ncbi:MAG: TIGR01777 family oxidoreductase [Candidatus Sericytochromatia bacterium]
MNIFITGGTGLIGKILVKRLIERGDNVTVITRNKDKAKKFFYDKVNIIEGNIIQKGDWQNIIGNFDTIINLAGEPVASKRWTESEKQNIYDSRIKTTDNIVEAIKKSKNKPQNLINASAVGYYGFQADEREINETETSGKDFLSYLCRDWEDSARKVEKLGVRVVRLRIGIVLSENGGALEKMVAPFKLYAGGHIGDGKQWLPWIHIDDVINMILFILDNNKITGAVNITAPNPTTMKDFCKEMGKIINRPSWLPVPSIALKATFGEMSDIITSGQKAIPQKVLSNGFKFEYEKIDKALKNLL